MNYLTAQLTKKNSIKGFTLIELMVVIAIIAVLAVVGAAVYGNLTVGARDARRDADLEAIANAAEANYSMTAGTYTVAATHFQSGVIPSDPISGQVYCIWGSSTAAAQAANPSGFVGTAATCTAAGQNVNSVTGAAFTASSISGWRWFKVCAYKEDTGASPRLICKNNQRS